MGKSWPVGLGDTLSLTFCLSRTRRSALVFKMQELSVAPKLLSIKAGKAQLRMRHSSHNRVKLSFVVCRAPEELGEALGDQQEPGVL